MLTNHKLVHRGYTKPSLAKVDKNLCRRVTESRTNLTSFVVSKCSGKAWKVGRGQTCRFLLHEGSQVGDVNLWNYENTKEHFYSGKTRQIQSCHLSVGDRLWSNMPLIRPLATIVADSLEGYTPDVDGCGVHDVLGTRCDPYMHKLMTGSECQLSCHQLLCDAVKPFNLHESDIHDVFNIFMCTGIDAETHEYLIKGSPARTGDYIEIIAEIDLLLALSVCPYGDVSNECGTFVVPEKCHAMTVEISSVPDSVWDEWLSQFE